MSKTIKRFLGFFLAIAMMVTVITPSEVCNASTTGNYTYLGYTGAAWVRDTTSGHSPLSFAECFSGTYTLEVDYLTYSTAFSVLVAKTKFNTVKSILENTGMAAAALAVCEIAAKLGHPVSAIAGAAVSVVIGVGYSILAALDTQAFNDACNGLKNHQLVKVIYITANNVLCKCYEKFTSSSYTIQGSGYNRYVLPNPYSGTYGEWKNGTYGYLYNL